MALDPLEHRAKRVDLDDLVELGQPELEHRGDVGRFALDEVRARRLPDPLAVVHEVVELFGRRLPETSRDARAGVREVLINLELGAIGPEVAEGGLVLDQLELVLHPRAACLEELAHAAGHGHQARASVKGHAVDGLVTDLSSRA